MGCIPWLKPITIMINKNTIRFTIPYAPIAKSPPYVFKLLLIRITTKQAHKFIKNGDNPIASIPPTI